MYQRYSADWVCAGLFYVRATTAGLWVMREVQKLMDDFTITDQDAFQAVLTGHTQVAVPQIKRRAMYLAAANAASAFNSSGGSGSSANAGRATGGAGSSVGAGAGTILSAGANAGASAGAGAGAGAGTGDASVGASHSFGARPIGGWLKPLWLEGLGPHENLRNTKGIQPLNTPMKENMWLRLSAKKAARGLSWETMPLNQFGNGPMLVHHWDTMFAHRGGSGGANPSGTFMSIHANCNTKALLAADTQAQSFLLRPGLAADVQMGAGAGGGRKLEEKATVVKERSAREGARQARATASATDPARGCARVPRDVHAVAGVVWGGPMT
eukprot:6181161-Pleurochrysis_carterae.AAC.1